MTVAFKLVLTLLLIVCDVNARTVTYRNGVTPTCCDGDGTCDDGDDDYCCGGDFYCSNDGEDYARGMGGVLCPDSLPMTCPSSVTSPPTPTSGPSQNPPTSAPFNPWNEPTDTPTSPAIDPPNGQCNETLSGSLQSGYRGCQTRTRSGSTCQRWDAQSPNEHFGPTTPEAVPEAGLDSNYCRNPDGGPEIWCYTMDGDRFEYCDPLAQGSTSPLPAELYADGCGIDCHSSVGVPTTNGDTCIGMVNQPPTLSYATGAHGTTCLSGTDLPSG